MGILSGKRKPFRRSSTIVAVRPHSGESGDCTPGHQQSFPFDLAAPRLVAAAAVAGTVHDMTTQESTSAPESCAIGIGDVLELVLEFHTAFDLPRKALPSALIEDSLAQLRIRLLREEAEEFADAVQRRDVVAIADALADVVYVAYGSALTYGIDLDAVVREVHRSNMSKLDLHGRPVLRDDGKVLKSERYRRPDVQAELSRQLPLFACSDDHDAAVGEYAAS